MLPGDVICADLFNFFFNKKNKKDYSFVYSLGGEFFLNLKHTNIYIYAFFFKHFRVQKFWSKSPIKKILRLLIVIICRVI